ncbi:MAG: uridine diphosphate-N-acetylglucosamine-binding protein YvcK [Anaerolineae bacterium]|nr:uridine diphosphate-N-acetylglucosamine-binding protein YvcK [Anaerolineae bacterium]
MLASLKSASRWLHPGLGLKRWLAPLLLGVIILALGIALFLRDLYAESSYPSFLHLLLLQGWPRWLRATLFGTVGLGLVAFSIYQLNKTLLSAFLPHKVTAAYVAEQVYFRQRQRQGPKVVAIGGGTGLSILLRGLKRHTDNIIALVTVADDGGSSGKLRRELGVLPPGDFRNCIAALADDEALTTQLFQYRFRSGQGLEGHSFGNLFITAMAGVTGTFEKALYESGRVLNIRGTILPSTLENVILMAEVNEGTQTRKVEGESAIPAAKLPIERVYLEPDTPHAFPPALQALLSADLIVAGPGSLYTSVIPNLLVAEIAAAIRASSAPKIYICNVATQPGETDGYSLDDHVQAIEAHANLSFNFVLANNNLAHSVPEDMSHLQAILPIPPSDNRYAVIAADVVDEQHPWRHDPVKLADELMSWYKKFK